MSSSTMTTAPQGVSDRATDPDWWRGAVIYQIYPRSFQDSNGDGIGDLVGITQRLDYVADLGVDAIWLSPFFTSPMKDFGYDVSDYRGVDPIFGTLDDFDRLTERAHSLGLKVVIDQVISHTSDQHAWFAESRHSRTNERSDWYCWSDPRPDGSPPNNWLSIFGGSAWTWDPRRCQYYLHNFLASQPDLNFHNADVRKALLSECRFWLERGVDGFRLDTVNFYYHSQGLESNPPVDPEEYNASIAPAVNPYNLQDHLYDKSQPENLPFLMQLRALLDEYPGTTTVGEVGDAQRQLEIMSAYTSGHNKLHMAYTFDFLGGEYDAGYFHDRIADLEEMVGDGWPCWAFSNHDVMRHISRWQVAHGYELRFAKQAAMLMLCLRGSVCVYQGEELGLTEAELSFDDLVDPYGIEFWPNYKGRDGCRTPMVWQAASHLGAFSAAPKAWLPVPADHLVHAVDRLEEDPESILNFYRAFIAERRQRPELVKGDIELLDSGTGVLAFIRRHGNAETLCVFNMTSDERDFELPSGLDIEQNDWHGDLVPRQGGHLNLDAYIGLMVRIV
ncbi:alpha-glucosidase [Cucumibacter marinus]|uniref:alpha-glucosidase n=1 Tax=Cucumibacter marinus TaxID=1121252 RepID=UPI0006869B79